MKKKSFVSALLLLIGYLGLYNGYLAIWYHNSPDPAAVLPYSEALYPEADRNSLKSGIPFRNTKELAVLLEDFLS